MCLRWILGILKCWLSALDLEFDKKDVRTDAKKSGVCGQGQGQRSGKLEDKARLKASASKNKPKVWKPGGWSRDGQWQKVLGSQGR